MDFSTSGSRYEWVSVRVGDVAESGFCTVLLVGFHFCRIGKVIFLVLLACIIVQFSLISGSLKSSISTCFDQCGDEAKSGFQYTVLLVCFSNFSRIRNVFFSFPVSLYYCSVFHNFRFLQIINFNVFRSIWR